MPPAQSQDHEWTGFELQTMLSLIARGVHLEQHPNKRTDAPSQARKNAQEIFYTALNTALHGKDFTQDINKREVTRMLDQVLEERKHVVGKGGLAERQTSGRITRTLTSAWKRPTKSIDFDGSLGEWEQGRKERVLHGCRDQRGSKKAPLDSGIGIAARPIDSGQKNAIWAAAENAKRPNMGHYEVGFAEMKNPSDHANFNNSAVLTKSNPKKTNNTSDYALDIFTAKDGYSSGTTVTPSKQKRAGRRTRVLSSPRVLPAVYACSSESEGGQTPTSTILSHENSNSVSCTGGPVESYHSPTGTSTSNFYKPSTLKNQEATQDRRSINVSCNSTCGGISPSGLSDFASIMDVSSDVQTPVASSLLGPRFKSSELSPMAAFNASYEKQLASGAQNNMIGTGLYSPGSDIGMNKNHARNLVIDNTRAELEADSATGLQPADEYE
ncbi:hypothetical protein QTJ16_005798 [Diplocarpon rosae]|uniref:Uncharacterized protein n=1 Tax=Diplocarpon rosae TaxID=946125 RepID=A0AAD9SXQ8_9HELO|nr:hypothetical protein QTJ16_005798 [Diplocarpon rosae]